MVKIVKAERDELVDLKGESLVGGGFSAVNFGSFLVMQGIVAETGRRVSVTNISSNRGVAVSFHIN